VIKNILNYTKNLICFAVSSLLLLSISYATFDLNVPTEIKYNADYTANSIGNYSKSTIGSTIRNYTSNPTDPSYSSDFNTMISYLSSIGLSNYYICSNGSQYGYCFFDSTSDLGFYLYDSENSDYYMVAVSPSSSSTAYFQMLGSSNLYNISNNTNNYSYHIATKNSNYVSYMNDNYPIKSVNSVNGNYVWEGAYYRTVGPSYIPTNEEIAEKVQAFYDSDLFQNQSDFKDYFVLYNYNNEVFSFIGHNLTGTITDTNGTHDNMSLLGQVIYSADYPTNNIGQTYWTFRLETDWASIVNFFNGNKYYLYATTLDSETITYTGMGSISDLVQLKFDPTYSTIVYSTKDYMVTVFDNPSPPDPDYGTRDIISGDLYTYDENIDPTTSDYNPITNYVLPDSVDTLISNADIPGLLQIWVTPDFSNMGWIFLAISSFWGYFGGFVLLTAIMFFIMWLLRG